MVGNSFNDAPAFAPLRRARVALKRRPKLRGVVLLVDELDLLATTLNIERRNPLHRPFHATGLTVHRVAETPLLCSFHLAGNGFISRPSVT